MRNSHIVDNNFLQCQVSLSRTVPVDVYLASVVTSALEAGLVTLVSSLKLVLFFFYFFFWKLN